MPGDEACRIVAEEILGWKYVPPNHKTGFPEYWKHDGIQTDLSSILTGNGELELFDELRSMGFNIVISTSDQGTMAWIKKNNEKAHYHTTEDDRPLALVMATAKMIEAEKKSQSCGHGGHAVGAT